MATPRQRDTTTSRKARGSSGSGATRARSNGGEGSSPRASAAASGARSSRSRGGTSNASPKRNSPAASNRTSASRTRGRAGGGSRSRSNGNGSETNVRERATETVSSAASSVRDTAAEAGHTIGLPVATGTLGAAAGIAGGVLLGRTIAKRPKKVLGITMPHHQADFSDVVRSVNAAGKQLGSLAKEVRTARQKAEEIGKALT
jgi:hypothetical protein